MTTAIAVKATLISTTSWLVISSVGSWRNTSVRLLEYAVANPDHGMLLQMGGFMLYTLGTLLLAGALLRAVSVPRWLPIAMVALTIAQFATSDRILDFVQIAAMAVLVILAALALRRSTASA